MTFEEMFRRATGLDPYPWQSKVAEGGLPEAIDIETGAGKTAGVVLTWLYRRRHHPEESVRAATPPWLVFALPMRSLVEQTQRAIDDWLERLDDRDTRCYRLLGGEGRVDSGWRERPGQPTVIVGTVDMLLSRALMRGYGSSRWVWPVEYGLLHTGSHWVFDEVQLLGPALATSRQLDAFRSTFETVAPCSSTWMSATLRTDRLRTFDNPDVPEPVVLTSGDHDRGLGKRLSGTRTISHLHADTAAELARGAFDAHRSGSLTLVVVNLVKRAQETHRRLARLAGSDGPAVELLHSRFRPADRAAVIERALDAPVDPDGPGRIVVATQVVEAGIDISARTLITDAAPWSSIAQRAGRCNRAGEFIDAQLWWVTPPTPHPYDANDVSAAIEALITLEGERATTTILRELSAQVPETEEIVPVLRRRDLIDLFDTSPDLIGNDVDVARFIRADDDTDIQIAWRAGAEGIDGSAPFSGGPIRAEELCRVSVADATKWLRSTTAWLPDHLGAKRRWKRLQMFAVRPGSVVVVDTDDGGYAPATGWDGTTKSAVPPVPMAETTTVEVAPVDESTSDDPASFLNAWVTLDDHLGDTRRAAVALLAQVQTPGIREPLLDAVVAAAAVHDIGKVHDVFQDTLLRSADDGEHRVKAERLRPLAKSGSGRHTRHRRPNFRHELVSALLLAAHEQPLLGAARDEADLVRYLVAAHHGRVRMAIRSVPGESAPPGFRRARTALGVVDGEVVDEFSVGGVTIDVTTLSLDAMALGGDGSWTAMALRLRDRADLGLFRLATLEALVRLADWRASAEPTATGLPAVAADPDLVSSS